MKFLFTTVTALLCLSATAQKLEKPIIDKITGDTTLQTKTEVLQNKFSLVTHYLACNTIKLSNHYMVRFKMNEGLNVVFSIQKGDKADIKLSDGKVIELVTPLDKTSDLGHNSYGGYATADIMYDLTDDAISELKNKKVSVIRIVTSKGPFDYEISDGKSEIIKNQLNLITSR